MTLISFISEFEHDYNKKNVDRTLQPSADVLYQWNLETLGLICPLLAEALNRDMNGGIK